MSALCKFVTVNRRYRRFCPHQIFILIGSWWRFSGHHRVALPHWRSEFESCWSQQIVLCRLKSFFKRRKLTEERPRPSSTEAVIHVAVANQQFCSISPPWWLASLKIDWLALIFFMLHWGKSIMRSAHVTFTFNTLSISKTGRQLQLAYSFLLFRYFLWLQIWIFKFIFYYLQAAWPEKNRQMSKKLPKNDYARKMKDFDTFTTIA